MFQERDVATYLFLFLTLSLSLRFSVLPTINLYILTLLEAEKYNIFRSKTRTKKKMYKIFCWFLNESKNNIFEKVIRKTQTHSAEKIPKNRIRRVYAKLKGIEKNRKVKIKDIYILENMNFCLTKNFMKFWFHLFDLVWKAVRFLIKKIDMQEAIKVYPIAWGSCNNLKCKIISKIV